MPLTNFISRSIDTVCSSYWSCGGQARDDAQHRRQAFELVVRAQEELRLVVARRVSASPAE